MFAVRYTNPIGKKDSTYFSCGVKHRPLYVLNGDIVEALIMPWNVNWNNPIYSFLRRSVEDWFTKGAYAITNFDENLQKVLDNHA